MEKEPEAFRTISEVGEELDVPQHVLRFWETRFSQIRPMKRGGGRRYYRVNDVDLLKGIRQLLYGKGYTIKGVQRILKEHGVAHVTDIGRGEEPVSEQASPVAQKTASPSAQKQTATPSASSSGTVNDEAESTPADILTPVDREELKLALADLAAAKRLLTGEKIT